MCQARAETRAGKALTPCSTLTLALALAQALAQASQALAVCQARAKTRAGMALTPCLPLALALALALALCLDTAEMAAKTKETGRQRPSRSPGRAPHPSRPASQMSRLPGSPLEAKERERQGHPRTPTPLALRAQQTCSVAAPKGQPWS